MSDTPEGLITSGYEARRERRPQDAKQFFVEAIGLSRCAAAQESLARALTGLGQIERDLGNTSAAVEHYREAVSIYRTLSDPLKLAHTIRHVGDILRHEGAIEDARPCYEEALSIYREHDERSDLDLANMLKGYALLREDAHEIHEAKPLWQEARQLYEAANVPQGIEESTAHLRR